MHFRTHLDEQEEVRILALRGRTVALLDVVFGDVDTLASIMPSVSCVHTASNVELTIFDVPGRVEGTNESTREVRLELYSSTE